MEPGLQLRPESREAIPLALRALWNPIEEVVRPSGASLRHAKVR